MSLRKYFFEALILSVCIGVMIRASLLLVTGQPLFSNGFSYLISILIAVVSCSITFFIHFKVLVNSRYTLRVKYMVSSVLILFVYLLGNLMFGGLSIVSEVAFYVYAVIILLLSFPLIFHVNKKIQNYDQYLQLKQSKNSNSL
ncbi:hypothetical protein ACQ4XT_18310 [Halobacillus faecis]